jgi:hypothetical protein
LRQVSPAIGSHRQEHPVGRDCAPVTSPLIEFDRLLDELFSAVEIACVQRDVSKIRDRGGLGHPIV